MLNLENHLTLNKATIESGNLCDKFGDVDLKAIGIYVVDGFRRDKQSRSKWEKRTQSALDLAMQLQKDKNFPWPGCSNIAFPLVTIAAMQFHARAYPSIIQGTEVVKCRVVGEDPTGEKAKRSYRISCYMSWQVLEEDQSWEEQMDRLLIVLPIVGCAFKKTYFSPSERHNVSELVMPQDLVLDYYAKSVESCTRKTQIIALYRNEIHERIMRGAFRDIREETWYAQPPSNNPRPDAGQRDQRTGQTPPQSDQETPFSFLEQHIDLDLDDDGYAEPYIITVEETSGCCVRIVTRFERPEDIERNSRGEIITIRAREYFSKYPFIPSPDGGIYDVGFGVLLGPLNESTNAILNQLVDAGTMSNSAGGFLGRGAKIRGGIYTFAPLEWKRVDSTGEDLSKSIYPLPVREPSMVLFQLLQLLIGYTNRVSGATDTMVGENPGQNTPANNMNAMVEQGMKIYNAIFKRVWRSEKEEFKKLYVLNSIYLPIRKAFGTASGFILREDFLGDPNAVVPVADPNITSDTQRIQQAVTLKQAAATTPGYDPAAVEMRFLKALRVDAPEEVYPGTEKMPPGESEKITIEKMRLEGKRQELLWEQQKFVAQLQADQPLIQAQIMELQAQSAEIAAGIAGEEQQREISRIDAAIGAAKVRDERVRNQIDHMMRAIELTMHQRELDLKEKEINKKETTSA